MEMAPSRPFQAAANSATGKSPAGLGIADFDGDGLLDLVVADSGDGNAALLLGRGDGTFHLAMSFATGGTPVPVTVADFNGDHKPDLAVQSNDQNAVGVLLNVAQ